MSEGLWPGTGKLLERVAQTDADADAVAALVVIDQALAVAIEILHITAEALAVAGADTAWLSNFQVNGTFWEMLAYCAGTGGSCLIIGSAAGVAAMGMEKINFIWYLKKISLLAFLGYISGAATYIAISTLS